MPLHDWADERGFDSLHSIWQNQILYWTAPRLPPGYRATLAGMPAVRIDPRNGRPDVAVRTWSPPPRVAATSSTAIATLEPDAEVIGSFEADPIQAIHVSDPDGHLIAAIELVSPRNKDRYSSRQGYANRYMGYLRIGAHLLLIDILPQPAGFSFADEITNDFCLPYPPTPAPFAMSYRVGEPVPGGTLFAHWRRPLTVGQPLPTLPLALTVHRQVLIDLESTYNEAARWVFPT